MDITFLRTFLEVARVGHFGKAADALAITQSAVSARIKLLEDALGVELLQRKRNAILPTPAGRILQRYAETIVESWLQARQEIMLEKGMARTLAIEVGNGLWADLIRQLMDTACAYTPNLALNLRRQPEGRLLEGLLVGTTDLGLLLDPPPSHDISSWPVFQTQLQLYATEPDLELWKAVSRDYIYLDWGTQFAQQHVKHFGQKANPRLSTDDTALALEMIQAGGAAYLPSSLIDQGKITPTLYPVAEAPAFACLIYAVIRTSRKDEAIIRQLFPQISAKERTQTV